MWRDVIESVNLKRAETNFPLLFLACETLQFSWVMTNIHAKRSHSSTMSETGGGVVVKPCFFDFFEQN